MCKIHKISVPPSRNGFFSKTPHPLGGSSDLGEPPAHREFQSLLWGEYGPFWNCTINHNWRISCKKGVCISLLGRYTPFLHEILKLLKPCWFQIQIKKFVVIFIIDEDEYVKKNVATLIREIAKHTPEVCYY